MKLRLSRRRILAVLLAAAVIAWAGVLLSIRGQVSILGAIATDLSNYYIGWPADATGGAVFARMARYQRRGRYDAAIKAGVAWADKNPNDDSTYWIYVDVADLYLVRAKSEASHREEYADQAIFYADKALRSNDVLAPEMLVSTFEAAGDLSTHQRCAQYQRAVNLLQRSAAQNEKLAQAVMRMRVSAGREVEARNWVNGRSKEIDTEITRLKSKLHDSSCP
jgi:hypothetical protein